MQVHLCITSFPSRSKFIRVIRIHSCICVVLRIPPLSYLIYIVFPSLFEGRVKLDDFI